MSIVSLPQTVRGIQRLRQIVQVLSRHGFRHVVERLNLRRYVPLPGWWGRALPEDEIDPLAAIGTRLARVCEELGPTFVKLGQLASSRPDLVPAPIVEALSRLQDHVDPFDFQQARQIVESELGRSIEVLFSSFDEVPLASGSIAQVHAATTRDGQSVVVKVRRPGIDATVALDMHVIRWMVDLAVTHLHEVRVYNPRAILDEFAQTMMRELDFVYEASATQRFTEAMAAYPAIRIPRVNWELTSTSVLTMQRLTGTPFREAVLNGMVEFDRRAVARNMAECFLHQYFEMSLFHADPHPGNLLLYAPDGVGLIDFGMAGQVSDELRGHLVVALVAAIRREVDVVIEVLADLAAIGPETERHSLERELRELLEKYYGQPLKRLDTKTIFYEITDLMRRYHVALPRDFVMLGKSLVAIAGAALQLDPQLNLLELIQPRIRKMIGDRLAPKRLVRRFLTGSWHMASILGDAPRQIRDMVRRMGRGQFQVNIRHQNLDHLASEIDRSSNRLAFSIFLAATIIGSSMLMHSPQAQTILGFSLQYLGFVGYAVSFIMGLGLLFAILRSGKLS